MSTARENTLKKIANALRQGTEIPFPGQENVLPVFQIDQKDLMELFVKKFTALDGRLFFCSGEKALLDQLETLMNQHQWSNVCCHTSALLKGLRLESLPRINTGAWNDSEAGITDCECLVARTGTVVLSAVQESGRTLPVYVPIHLVIARVDDLVFDIGDAINRLVEKYRNHMPSALFFASGPSRTADIEKTLVLGVHGPKEVYLFLLGDEMIP